MSAVSFYSTKCPVCDTKDNARQLYPANFNSGDFNPDTFSARRLPDRIHYRLVKCSTCQLVRSDPVVDSGTIEKLYRQGLFNYSNEIENLKYTYGFYLNKLDNYGVKKENLLEIGCGNGFFLEQAQKQGFNRVIGIEPSSAAVAQSSLRIKPDIICDILRPGLFEAETFDVICLFQVLDHILNPDIFIKECFRIIKSGGLILCITHNIESLSAKILRDKNPIIDIEHAYLYSPNTISRIFMMNGYKIKDSGSVFNWYSLYYLLRLMPLPRHVKQSILTFLKAIRLGRIKLSVPLGNLYLIAQKP